MRHTVLMQYLSPGTIYPPFLLEFAPVIVPFSYSFPFATTLACPLISDDSLTPSSLKSCTAPKG
jgi:hypothetical protein